jgi:hypothetical protein
MHKRVIPALLLPLLLAAQETGRQKIQTTETQRMTFEPSAALRLENSIGQVRIEGWNRPDVEIKITKSTKSEYDDKTREEGAKELEKVTTSFTRKGEELVLATEYKKSSVPPPFRGGPPIDVLYEIKMPHEARLIVDQETGDVQLTQLNGEIRVTVKSGSINVAVPGDAPYSVDARSKFGTTTSNLATPQHGLFFMGEELNYESPKPVHKLYLRAKSGDIVILHSPRP